MMEQLTVLVGRSLRTDVCKYKLLDRGLQKALYKWELTQPGDFFLPFFLLPSWNNIGANMSPTLKSGPKDG